MNQRITLTGSAQSIAAPDLAADGPRGPADARGQRDVDVVLVRAGVANGLRFEPGLLAASVARFVGVPSYVDHAALSDATRPGQRSVRDLAGVVSGARYDVEREALVGRLHIYRPASWVTALADEAGDLAQFGLSAVLWVETEGRVVTRIREVESVDVVMNPAAGGRFLPRPPAERPSHGQSLSKGDETMSERTDREQESATLRVEQALPGEAQIPPQAPAAEDSPPRDTADQVRHPQMELALACSGLPEEACSAIREQFADRPPGADALDEALSDAIALYRRAYARDADRHTVRNLGRISDVLAPRDRISLAMERLMGLPLEERHGDIPRLSGIREAYDLITGDWERRGVFRGDRVSLANATTTTMAEIVANALNKVLLRQFESRPRWWGPVAYEEDFATLNDVRWITVGGFGDLDTVGEGDPYVEKTWDDYAETSTFIKKGNYIGLTLEMIDRDDVAAVRAIPRRLGHAAYRTLSAAVADLFTQESGTGPQLADGYRLFEDAHHHNLGSDPLSVDTWQATVAAMFKQEEYHSGKRLGVRPRYCLVPIDLEKTALEVFTSDVIPADGAFYRNVLRRSEDAIVVVPDWTDANDWAAAADPTELEGVCIGYRFGRSPEMFVADSEQGGAMFTNDEMRIKVRFVYAVGIGDYRALYKHNVV